MVLSSDLGLDSLDRAELNAILETTMSVEISDFDINDKTTVDDLRNLIKTANTSVHKRLNMNLFNKRSLLFKHLFQSLFLFPIHSLFVRVKIKNKDMFKKLDKPGIIIFNHVGILEAVCVMRALPLKNRLRMCVAADNYFWELEHLSWIKFFQEKGATSFPIGLDLTAYDHIFSNNGLVLISPEGFLQIENNKMHVFQRGTARIARELNVPIYPIKISENYRDIWPAKQKTVKNTPFIDMLPKRFGTVNVNIGKPEYLDKTKSDEEFMKKLSDIMKKL